MLPDESDSDYTLNNKEKYEKNLQELEQNIPKFTIFCHCTCKHS